jgi:subfamily B ATP-binding cassette protein MsbA
MLAWFVRELGPHWWRLTIATVAMVLSGLADAFMPVVMGKLVIQNAIIDQHLELLGHYMALAIALFAGSAILGAARMNIMHQLGQRLAYKMRVASYEHTQKLSLGFFHSHSTGDVMSRISNDVGAVEEMVVHGTDTIISDSLRVVFIIVILLRTNVELTLIGLLPLPLFLVGILVFAKFVRPLYEKIRWKLGEINTKLQENLSGIQVIKAFGREELELKEFEKSSGDYLRLSIRGIWMWTTFFPFLGFLTSSGMIAVVWVAALMTKTQTANVGDIVVFLGEMQQFYGPVGNLLRVHNVFNQALAALARIFGLLDEQPEPLDQPGGVELAECKGKVELIDVTFRYATGEEVLKDVTVVAEPGETVALVGRSGAGKTSMVSLIPRFFDPQKGEVRVDGIDAQEIKLESLRSNIGIVLQETFLFDGTARENIRYGRLDATDEEVEAAAKAAYAEEFIVHLPDGYETVVGERGVKLSGGQRQRVAIARAILKDPRILILDEATSLVDTEAEQMIQAALETLMAGRTTFVIAHRLSTVRKADKIVVIDEGAVVEQADHETLMERGGLYANMYTRQFHLQQYGMTSGIGSDMAEGAREDLEQSS